MTIQKATANETKQILQHSLNVMGEATAGHVEPNPVLIDQLMLPILSNGGYYLVKKESGVIQGWTGVGSQFDVYKQTLVGVIIELYVLPEHRKKGIAEELCLEAMRHLKRAGYKNVQLNVFAGNFAKQLYEKLGFHEVVTLMERKL